MDVILIVVCVAVLVGGGLIIFKRRAPHFKNLTEQDFLNINAAIVHPKLEAACQQMLKTVSKLASKALGHDVDYTHYRLLDLVQRVEIVDSFPDGGAMDVHRDPPDPSGITTIGIARWSLTDTIRFQHELLHRVVWDDTELRAHCALYRGDHWPAIFDPFGSH